MLQKKHASTSIGHFVDQLEVELPAVTDAVDDAYRGFYAIWSKLIPV